MNYTIRGKIIGAIGVMLISITSCEKMFDVEVDKTQVVVERVFGDDKSAESAMIGLYQSMVASSFAGGGTTGITVLTGLSSDEFENVLRDEDFVVFEQNELLAENNFVSSLWIEAYQIIYQANDIMEEVEAAGNINSSLKNQLRGEALFIRAFCHFYLLNLFGDVPLVLTANYHSNAVISRLDSAAVYNAIVKDLTEAENLLPEEYLRPERIRPNKFTAKALLSRVYLYTKDWTSAIQKSSEIIDHPGYNLEPDLNSVFLKESRETIFQLASESQNNTKDGSAMEIAGVGYGTNEMTDDLLTSFEPTDNRLANWTSSYSEGPNQELMFPYKYKADYFSINVEHFVVFRLAEQYLIRAEAYALNGNTDGALDDLNAIRDRAGLDSIQNDNGSLGIDSILNLIIKEKRSEFFAEWGHRWFDLKRTGRSTKVLSILKPTWSQNDRLYPIPASELNLNPKLGEQNPGY